MTSPIRERDVEPRWLLLIHHLPPTPAYLRVKVRRRLDALGAVALKPSVYALPRNEERAEEAEWLRREIVAAGGEAILCAASLLAGLTDADVLARFSSARNADYQGVIAAANGVRLPKKKRADAQWAALRRELARLRAQLAAIAAIDYFQAPLGQVATAVLEALAAKLAPAAAPGPTPGSVIRPGTTWVTRTNVHVDRIASAWLIQRFLDEEAKFLFVPSREHHPRKGEVRFDMYQAEFGHEGADCTFEVLLRHSQRQDPALRAIASMVHDIDLRDGKFQRPATAGFEQIIAGICLQHGEDLTRIARGGAVLDDLYGYLRRQERV